MKNSITLNIETQSEDNHIVSICHVNEKVISLEISDIARKMYRLNRNLFDKINGSTKLIGGVIYRQQTLKPKENWNRLSTKFFNAAEHEEKQIANLMFENNMLKRQNRAITKKGRRFDYDPYMISGENAGGYFDEKKLSPDDVSESTLISTIEEIPLFQDAGIKTIMIMDTLEDTKTILEVGYRIEIIVETQFRSFLDYCLKQADKSILFLTSYLNTLKEGRAYDTGQMKFNKNYSNRILNDLGLSSGVSDLSSQRIKDSDFGKVAISYYNLATLMSSNTDANIYSSILRKILPYDKTTPDIISKFLSNFASLRKNVENHYITFKDRSSLFSKVSNSKNTTNSIVAVSKEKFQIEQEVLGYSVFSENQKGLNVFSSEDYKTRFALEQAKYYPNINISDNTNFMTSEEKGRFSRMDNIATFLTPTTLLMGKEKISTNRGMVNMNVDKVRQFRLAKSSRAQEQKSSNFPSNITRGKIGNDILGSYNIQISSPRTSILERGVDQEIDPLIDCKHYLGDNSYFVTNNPQTLMQQFRRILREEDKRILSIVSDIVPRRFLRHPKAIKSIREIQFSNPNSKVRNLATAGELRIEDIPPHVKFMMTDEFNPNPNSDPLKNSESREIIEETQKNLFMVKALVGFDKTNGFPDINKPIYQQMDSSVLSSGRPVLAKAFDYEIPELGIVKDNYMGTIYNNLMYIRG